MTTFHVIVSQKGLQEKAFKKELEEIKEFYQKANISFYREVPSITKQDRFNKAMSMISSEKEELETLKEELENWKDNLPEQLVGGDKDSELEEAISQLEEIIDLIDQFDGNIVDFPNAFG